MKNSKKSIKTLIIDPSQHQVSPYLHLSKYYDITRVDGTKAAFEYILDFCPDLVIISTKLKEADVVDFLLDLKCVCRYKLIPIIFVINFSNRLNFIPGTNWGGKLGILHDLSSKAEVEATLERVLSSL